MNPGNATPDPTDPEVSPTEATDPGAPAPLVNGVYKTRYGDLTPEQVEDWKSRRGYDPTSAVQPVICPYFGPDKLPAEPPSGGVDFDDLPTEPVVSLPVAAPSADTIQPDSDEDPVDWCGTGVPEPSEPARDGGGTE